MKFKFTKKTLFLFTALVAILFLGKTVFAVWNGTFYEPGDTLNPECLPTDPDCDVRPPLTSLNINDTAYGVTWDADMTHAPSKNAVYDKIETLATVSHNVVTLGTANGLSLATQVLSLALASTSTTGALSSADWNTFNAKQGVLTNSIGLSGALSDETGSGLTVFNDSPTLVTPVLGVATATSINGLTITSNGTNTLNIAAGKTLTASNTLTFTGTDSSSIAFGVGGTVAYTSNKLSNFAATTSAELAGVMSDETGSGALVFATTPTFTTSAIVPQLYGGIAANDDITIEGTSHATKTSSYVILQPTTGNVGIGTTTPTAKLDIQTAIGFNRGLLIGPKTSTDGDGGYIEFTSSSVDGFGAQIGGLREGGAGINSLVFRTGGNTQAERMRITNAGNVGIGTTSPTLGKLQIQQSGITVNSGLAVINSGSTQGAYLWIDSNLKGRLDVGGDGSGSLSINGQGSGNVGIGTTVPGQKLDINSATGVNLRLTYNDADGSATNYADLRTTSAGGLTLLPSGNLINIGGGTTATDLRFLEPSASGANYSAFKAVAQAGDITYSLPPALVAGNQLTDVAGDGVLTWAAAGSTRALKNIVDTITDPNIALDQILSTPIYRFHYKEGKGTGDSTTEYVGVMADEAAWAMHYGGTVVNPVNTLGYMVLGMKATNTKIEDLGLKINDFQGLNNFDTENSWRDSLVAWFSNAENRITRIFTGEVCLTDPGQEAVCLNRSELQELKGLLNDNGDPEPESTPDPDPTPDVVPVVDPTPTPEPTPTPTPEPTPDPTPTPEIIPDIPSTPDPTPGQ